MGSSPGFGLNPSDLPDKSGCALFGLAFAVAPQVSLLNPATEIHSPAHSSIGTPSSARRRTPTVCRHAVSGTFNSPPGVLFHLSLTVLLHYRSLGVFSLGKWSSQLPTGFLVSRGTQEHKPGRPCSLAYEAVTLSGGPFQGPSAGAGLCNSPAGHTVRPVCVLQPPQGIGPCAVTFLAGLGFSPFARRYSGNNLFSSGYLDVSVPPVPFPPQAGCSGYSPKRVAPFGNPRLSLLDS